MQDRNIIVQAGLEVTPGIPVTTTLAWAIPAGGYKAVPTNNVAEFRDNTTFPSKTEKETVASTWKITLSVDLNKNNIRDILLLATKRTSGVLPYFTLIDNQFGLGPRRFSGCQVASLAFRARRGATADEGSIVSAELEIECMTGEPGQGTIQSLTPAVSTRFQMRRGTFLINNVSATEVLETMISIKNQLSLGPVDGSNKRLWIEAGDETVEVQDTARFTTNAWMLLAGNGATAPAIAATNTHTFATGTVNETVTFAMGKAAIATQDMGEDEGLKTEQITFEPFHTGAAHQLIITFGSAIGATVLGL